MTNTYRVGPVPVHAFPRLLGNRSMNRLIISALSNGMDRITYLDLDLFILFYFKDFRPLEI